MSTPIIEYIAANLKTTIDGITTTAGYNQTLSGHRPRRVDFYDSSFVDKDVLICQREVEDSNEEKPIQSAQYWQHFDIVIYIIDPDSSTDPIDTRINATVADVTKAVLVDRHRGGYAIDTKVGKPTIMDDEGGISSGVVLDVSVQYRTREDDPYTAL